MKRLRHRGLTCCFILCGLTFAASPSCVKLPRTPSSEQSTQHTRAASQVQTVSLNRATQRELERLPGVGPALAARIVEHRERHGPFRRVEHVMLVRGFGERRFRRIEPFITAE